MKLFLRKSRALLLFLCMLGTLSVLYPTSVALAQQPGASCEGNLLINPGFEDGNHGVAYGITGWESTERVVSVGTGLWWDTASDVPTEGNWYMYRHYGYSAIQRVWQDVPNISGNTELELYFDGGASTRTGNHQVYIEFYNAAGNRIGTSERIDVDAPELNMQPYSLTTTTPPGTSSVRVEGTTTILYLVLDNMCLRDANPVTNNPPALANPGDQTNTAGDSVNLTVTATDADEDNLTFSATGLPNGLSMNNAGVIAGVITTVGSFSVTITVDDGNEGSDSVSYVWNVNAPVNNPPVLVNPGDRTDTVTDDVNLTITATDADEDNLTFSAMGLPNGLSMNNAGVIAGAVTTAGTFNVTVTVDDGNGGSDSISFSWTVNSLVATCGNLSQEAELAELAGDFVVGNDAAASGGSYIHVPEGTGNKGFGSASRATFCFNATEEGTYRLLGGVYAPDGTSDSFFVTVDGLPASGYTWKPLRNTQYANDYLNDNGTEVQLALGAGEHSVVLYLREDGTRLDTLTLERVDGTTNTPPVLANLGNQTNMVGDNASLTLTATDADEDALTYSAIGLPTGLSLNANTGQITGSPTTAGSYSVNVTVSDGRGGTDSATFDWVINSSGIGCGDLNQEAELAVLAGDFVVGNDAAASGGSYIHVPEGTGNKGFGSASRATFCFNVTEEGTYRLLGGVYAPDGTSDSFFVTVDGLPASGYTWKPLRNTQYANGYLNDAGTEVQLALGAGEHTVVLYLREDGTRLDTLTLERVGGAINTPPVLANPGNQTNMVGDNASLALTATDADEDTLTYSADGLPTGLSLNANTGQITGSPSTAGSYTVSVSVADGQGGSDSVTFNWLVTDSTTACGGLNQEAEAAQLFGDFVISGDAGASGGRYIYVPDGTGNKAFGGASL